MMHEQTITFIDMKPFWDDDDQILDWIRAAENDLSNFRPLYDRFASPIYKYMLKLSGDPLVAEDLTSQLFVKALQNLQNYRAIGKFSSWLFAMAHNLAMDHFRKNKVYKVLSEELEEGIPHPTSITPGRATEIADLNRELSRLSKADQEILYLRYVLNFTYRETGKVIGIGEQAAKKRIYRILARLGQLLGVKDETNKL